MLKLIKIGAIVLLAGCGPANVEVISHHLTFSGGNTHTTFTLKTNARPHVLHIRVLTQHKVPGVPAPDNWQNLSLKVINLGDIPAVGHEKHYSVTGPCYQNTKERILVKGFWTADDGTLGKTRKFLPSKLGKATGDCGVPVPPGITRR